jgi:Tfp pilus assembly protein PilO
MARLSEKQKLLIIGGSALGLCLLAGGGVYWAQGLIDEEQHGIEAKKADIQIAEGKIAKIPATEREVILLRENLGEYVKILPETKDLTTFTRALDQFQKQSQVTMVSMVRGRPDTASTERFVRTEYNYEVTATLWQFMKFLNLIENYDRFVGVSALSISSANNIAKDLGGEGDTIHAMKMTMETYTYNAKGSGQDVDIPDYEEKRDALREEIFKQRTKIAIQHYEHRGMLGRRDIFVDPRTLTTPNSNHKGIPPAEQKKLIEQFVGEIQKLREMLLRARRPDTSVFDQFNLEKALKEGIAKQQEAAIKTEQTGTISFQPYRLRWTREVTEALDDMKRQVADLGKEKGPEQRDPFLPRAEMETLAADMERALLQGSLEEARTKFESIQIKLGVPADDPRYPLAVRMQELHLRAVTALEFQALNLKIQGVLVNRDGRSGVVLNGEVYEEGEYINDNLFVRAVREEQVHFVFKGLTLVRTL